MDDEALKIRKWADTGDRVLPEDSSLTPAINRAVGWPASFSAEDGDRPRRQVINQLFRELTGMAVDIREHGVLEYSADQDYDAGAIVQHGSPPNLYRATAANGPSSTVKTPGGGGVTEWEVVGRSTDIPGTPPTPQATAGQGQVRWFWGCPQDNGAPILDFEWQRRIGNQAWASAATGTITTLHFDDTGLTNGTQYSFRYRARNSEGNSVWSASVSASPQAQVPDGIRGAVGFGTADTIEVHWAEPDANGSDVFQYEVQWRQQGGSFSGARSRTVTQRTYTITGLSASTNYQFRVRARNRRGWGRYSDIVNEATTAVSGPTVAAPAPTATPVGSGGRRQIEWTWTPGADNGAAITSYDVQWRTGSNPWSSGSQVSRSGTFWTQTGIADSTAIEARVRAVNSAGASPFSTAGMATTLPAQAPADLVPGVPEFLTGEIAGGRAWWFWEPPVDTGGSRITGYDFQWRRIGSTTWTGNIQTVTQTNAVLSLGANNIVTGVEGRVRAKNTSGSGDWGDPTSLGVPPSAPLLRAAALDSAVDLQITPGPHQGGTITDYVVQYKSGAESYSTSREIGRGGDNRRTHTLTGLNNGTTYTFRAVAINSEGPGDWSIEVTATPQASRVEFTTPGTRDFVWPWDTTIGQFVVAGADGGGGGGGGGGGSGGHPGTGGIVENSHPWSGGAGGDPNGAQPTSLDGRDADRSSRGGGAGGTANAAGQEGAGGIGGGTRRGIGGTSGISGDPGGVESGGGGGGASARTGGGGGGAGGSGGGDSVVAFAGATYTSNGGHGGGGGGGGAGGRDFNTEPPRSANHGTDLSDDDSTAGQGGVAGGGGYLPDTQGAHNGAGGGAGGNGSLGFSRVVTIGGLSKGATVRIVVGAGGSGGGGGGGGESRSTAAENGAEGGSGTSGGSGSVVVTPLY